MSWENMKRPVCISHPFPCPKGRSMAGEVKEFEIENAQHIT
jgi:hypothetical protein